MPIKPEDRQRLMDLMEARRLELGLTWREVGDEAGVSYEAIRNFRQGPGGMRPLTRRRLSVALEWDPRRVDVILAGEDRLSAAPPDAPQVVRDNWANEDVRTFWALPVSPAQRIALVTAYLSETGAAAAQC